MLTAPYPYALSFVVPALNEEGVLESFIEQVVDVSKDKLPCYEIILINDGSSDATGVIMDRLATRHKTVRVLHNERNIGWGASYQRGLKQARCDYVMLLCGDGGLPARSLPPILEQLGRADIVVPYMTNLRKIKSPGRFILSRSYTGLLNLLFGAHLRYYNGLAVHRRDLLQNISITSGGFGFQAEILIKLIKSGCTFIEVGIEGAEEKQQSFALRPRNIMSVVRTIIYLLLEISRFVPVPKEVILKGRPHCEGITMGAASAGVSSPNS